MSGVHSLSQPGTEAKDRAEKRDPSDEHLYLSRLCLAGMDLRGAGKLDTYCIKSGLRPASSRVVVAWRSRQHATFHESHAGIGAIVQRPLCVSC